MKVYIMSIEGSTNSTKVNRRRLQPKERHELHVEDELIFGKDGPYKLVDLNYVVRPQPAQTIPNAAPRIEKTEGFSRIEKERTAKRGIDERISLTNPDAKNFIEQKLRERLNQDSVLNRHAENLKEEDTKKARLRELLTKQTLLQEKVNHLKAKSEELATDLANVEEAKKKAEVEMNYGQESTSKVTISHLDRFLSESLGGICG